MSEFKLKRPKYIFLETIDSLYAFCDNMERESELIWFNVPSPTRFYTGREKEVEIIDEQWVECEKKKTLLFVAITGLGGIGKTELAANYAKHFYEFKRGHCIWIDAESNQTLQHNFQNLANLEMKIPLKDELGQEKELNHLVGQIHEKLTNRKCLYIFDNLDSYKQPAIQQLKVLESTQRSSALVLMTSRFQPAKTYFGNNCLTLELNILNDQAAFEFFCDYFRLKENVINDINTVTNVIARLCRRLNCFPLAMQQAANYINENLSHSSERDTSEVQGEVEEYLHKIENQTKKLLNHNLPGTIVSHTTLLTWGITFQKISKMADVGIEATKLMNLISFMTPDNISVEFLVKIFESLEGESSSPLHIDALEILRDHSIVKLENRKTILSVHRLVQEVTRIKLIERSEWIGTLDNLLLVVEQMMEANEIKSDQLIHVQRIWKHATENVELIVKHAEFPSCVVKALLDSGKYREMFDFSCQALTTLQSTLGDNHRWTLKIKYSKGLALNFLGEYLKALELLTEVYEKQKELFGKEDGDCLETADRIGSSHWRLEEYDEALKWYHNALEKRERVFGKEHHSTVSLKHNMALVLEGQGKHKEAMELYEQVLEVRERVLGEDHPETLKTKHNIAAVRSSQGEYFDALKMLLEVLQVEERVLESNHPDTLDTKDWIAGTYRRLGRTEEAFELQKEVLEKREEILGPEHPDTLITKHNIAALRFSLGDYVDALNMFLEVLEMRERVLGVNHPVTLNTKEWIAETYSRLGRKKTAVEMHNEVLEKRKKILGPQHPDTMRSQVNALKSNKNCSIV